jgi:uncharacterized paraquat-inducible protein A
MIYALCPNCHSDIRFVNLTAGKKCVCPGCSMLLIVVKLSPIELDFFTEVNIDAIEESEPDYSDDWEH